MMAYFVLWVYFLLNQSHHNSQHKSDICFISITVPNTYEGILMDIKHFCAFHFKLATIHGIRNSLINSMHGLGPRLGHLQNILGKLCPVMYSHHLWYTDPGLACLCSLHVWRCGCVIDKRSIWE